MTPNEYLDAAKQALNITSDYELAKRLEIPRSYVPSIRSGKRHVPVDTAFRLAITLNLDPALVVADLECQREAQGKRGDFWKGFLSRAALVAALVCTLASNFSVMPGNELARVGGKKRRFQYA